MGVEPVTLDVAPRPRPVRAVRGAAARSGARVVPARARRAHRRRCRGGAARRPVRRGVAPRFDATGLCVGRQAPSSAGGTVTIEQVDCAPDSSSHVHGDRPRRPSSSSADVACPRSTRSSTRSTGRGTVMTYPAAKSHGHCPITARGAVGRSRSICPNERRRVARSAIVGRCWHGRSTSSSRRGVRGVARRVALLRPMRGDLLALAPPWCARCGAPGPRRCPRAAIAHPAASPRPGAVRVRGAGAATIHHLKYRGVRGVGSSAGGRHATLRSARGSRRRDLGAARPPPKGRARVRSGEGARGGGRPGARPPGRGCSAVSSRPARRPARGRRAPDGDARLVRRSRSRDRASERAARRRRAHHRRDRRRVRRGCASAGASHVLARSWLHGRSCAPDRPCLYSTGPSSGSVVARGSSPVVDASRGRNDPRKATLGR